MGKFQLPRYIVIIVVLYTDLIKATFAGCLFKMVTLKMQFFSIILFYCLSSVVLFRHINIPCPHIACGRDTVVIVSTKWQTYLPLMSICVAVSVRFGEGTMKALLEPVFLYSCHFDILPVTPKLQHVVKDPAVLADFVLLFHCVCFAVS